MLHPYGMLCRTEHFEKSYTTLQRHDSFFSLYLFVGDDLNTLI